MTGAARTKAVRSRHRIKVLDRAFFLLESDEATCHVGLLAIFSPPAGAGPDFVRDLVAAMRERRDVAPPFTYKLARHRPPFLLGPWVELLPDEVDLDYHFTHSALPRPGGQRELGILISRLHSRPLDPSRPMWEQHIVEGLKDGRFALYFKVHHSLMDGVSGTRKFARSLMQDPDDDIARPIWTVDPGVRGTTRGRARGTDDSLTRRLLAIVKWVAGGRAPLLAAIRNPREFLDAERTVPFLGPVSPTLNGRVSRQRRVVTQTYELTRLRAIAASSGVSLNDVYLAVCAGAIRRYLEGIGEPQVRSLTAGVPVSLRQSGDSTSGNAIGMLAAKLHTNIVNPAERLHAINQSATTSKESLQRVPPAVRAHQTVLATSPLMVQSLVGLAGRGGRPHTNLVLSNVPGPSELHYLGGAKLEEAYPLSMLMHGQTLNITAYSTGGRLNIGVVGCRDQLPHLQRMAAYLADALAELETSTLVGG